MMTKKAETYRRLVVWLYFCVELVCGFFRIHLLKFVYHFTRKKGEAITITKERSVGKTKQTNEDHKHENFPVGSILVDCQIYYKINSILIPEGKGPRLLKLWTNSAVGFLAIIQNLNPCFSYNFIRQIWLLNSCITRSPNFYVLIPIRKAVALRAKNSYFCFFEAGLWGAESQTVHCGCDVIILTAFGTVSG
jgi:hypothetical protein